MPSTSQSLFFVGLLALGACGAPSDPGGDDAGEAGGINVMTADGTTGGVDSDGETGQSSASSTSSTSTTEGAEATTEDPTGSTGSTTMGVVSETEGDAEGSGDSSTGGDDDESGTTMDCPSAAVSFDPIVPTVILLVDQSGSMTASFGDSNRWDAVRDALIDPANGVVASLQDDVRFGLALYTSSGGTAGGECPMLIDGDPTIGNLDAITALYADESPQGDTPTGESIEAVTATLLADPTTGPKIIVVATDGEPDTCAVPNPQQGQPESVAAAEAAYTAGVETFIISVGNDVSQSHLQEMANAGIGWAPGDADAPFYVPADQAAMVSAFEDIINGVRTCVFDLDGSILPGREDEGTVTVNGMEIPYDDPDGWRVNDPSQIELVGAACDLIQSGDVDVQIAFTCEAILPG